MCCKFELNQRIEVLIRFYYAWIWNLVGLFTLKKWCQFPQNSLCRHLKLATSLGKEKTKFQKFLQKKKTFEIIFDKSRVWALKSDKNSRRYFSKLFFVTFFEKKRKKNWRRGSKLFSQWLCYVWKFQKSEWRVCIFKIWKNKFIFKRLQNILKRITSQKPKCFFFDFRYFCHLEVFFW